MESVDIEKILKLGVSDRIELVEAIWDSVVEDPGALPVTEAQKHELERRLAEYRVNPNAGRTWEEVRGSLDSEQ